jgi:pimeloyl-ACP methyl ester carboxylesterase
MTQFTHDTAPTRYADGGGIRFAYRRFGIPECPPLVFFQHFMGTLDDHDPAVSDAFATDREVILFNNAGVASSTGTVPDTIEAMARDAASFIDTLGLTMIDMVGHSMGGLVAQEVALARPSWCAAWC